jgi:hypothetical protein
VCAERHEENLERICRLSHLSGHTENYGRLAGERSEYKMKVGRRIMISAFTPAMEVHMPGAAASKATSKATEKLADTQFGQRLINKGKDLYTGPNRGKAIAASVALGAAAIYALGPRRALGFIPVLAAGYKSAKSAD